MESRGTVGLLRIGQPFEERKGGREASPMVRMLMGDDDVRDEWT